MPLGLDAEAAAVIPASPLALWVSVAASGVSPSGVFYSAAAGE